MEPAVDDDAAKPKPFAILVRSTINPGAMQLVVRHFALTQSEIWDALEYAERGFRARNEKGEIDALVDLTNTIVNVVSWDDYEKLAAEARKQQAQQIVAAPAGFSPPVPIIRGR